MLPAKRNHAHPTYQFTQASPCRSNHMLGKAPPQLSTASLPESSAIAASLTAIACCVHALTCAWTCWHDAQYSFWVAVSSLMTKSGATTKSSVDVKLCVCTNVNVRGSLVRVCFQEPINVCIGDQVLQSLRDLLPQMPHQGRKRHPIPMEVTPRLCVPSTKNNGDIGFQQTHLFT